MCRAPLSSRRLTPSAPLTIRCSHAYPARASTPAAGASRDDPISARRATDDLSRKAPNLCDAARSVRCCRRPRNCLRRPQIKRQHNRNVIQTIGPARQRRVDLSAGADDAGVVGVGRLDARKLAADPAAHREELQAAQTVFAYLVRQKAQLTPKQQGQAETANSTVGALLADIAPDAPPPSAYAGLRQAPDAAALPAPPRALRGEAEGRVAAGVEPARRRRRRADEDARATRGGGGAGAPRRRRRRPRRRPRTACRSARSPPPRRRRRKRNRRRPTRRRPRPRALPTTSRRSNRSSTSTAAAVARAAAPPPRRRARGPPPPRRRRAPRRPRRRSSRPRHPPRRQTRRSGRLSSRRWIRCWRGGRWRNRSRCSASGSSPSCTSFSAASATPPR